MMGTSLWVLIAPPPPPLKKRESTELTSSWDLFQVRLPKKWQREKNHIEPLTIVLLLYAWPPDTSQHLYINFGQVVSTSLQILLENIFFNYPSPHAVQVHMCIRLHQTLRFSGSRRV